jgi:hypothetical protein
VSESSPVGTLVASVEVMEDPVLFRGVVCRLQPAAANKIFAVSRAPAARDGKRRSEGKGTHR